MRTNLLTNSGPPVIKFAEPGRGPVRIVAFSESEQGAATMGKASAKPPPPEEPADDDGSAWGEALAASFGFDTRNRLPAERDKPKPKPARKRKTPVKSD